MGEVMAAQDQRIGREVAVKRIRSRTPTHFKQLLPTRRAASDISPVR
jgi:hypothetical protein